MAVQPVGQLLQPAQLALYFELGVDGLFADNPDTARAVRDRVFNLG